MVFFGQLVSGPPGAGKSTCCNGMQQMCQALGRKHIVVNLDPANDELPYDCDVDVKDLITVESVMEEYSLGPNGGLVFCMEYLLANFDWLEEALGRHRGSYVIIDCPGQVELFTHHQALRHIIQSLEKKLDFRLTALHLVDSTFCTDPSKYISALLVSLGTQAQLELPHINILSKLDLLKHHAADLDFRIEFYAQAEGLSELLRQLVANAEHPLDRKFSSFEEALCEFVEDSNLISFQLLDIQNKESVLKLLKLVDTANGFCIGGLPAMSSPFDMILKPQIAGGVFESCFGDVQEKYIDKDDDVDETPGKF